MKANDPRAVAFPVAASAFLGLVFWVWQFPITTYETPRLLPWVLGCGFLVLLLAPQLPKVVWLWWGAGLLTLLWSLSPANTLLLGLWELGYLAAFAAGAWLVGTASLNIVLLGYGLFTTLVLSYAGLAVYFSGSAHYVAGAQALLLVPVAAAWLFRSRWQLLSSFVLVSALFLALSSGARAVYLPLLVILLLLIFRLIREGSKPWSVALGLGAVCAAVVALEFAMPFGPIRGAIGVKIEFAQQPRDLSPEGGIGSRLQMWGQTLAIAVAEPLGTGNGSFRDVLAAYQQYPGLGFSNAHNYYLETAATGGWPRLIALLAMLGWILWRGWNSPAWPWALGAAGLWVTLAFDITGMYPAVMMLAFASLGAVYGQIGRAEGRKDPGGSGGGPRAKHTGEALRSAVSVCGIALAVGLAAWWYWPCAEGCATGRYLGYRPAVLAEAARLSGAERRALLERAARLNPKSLWVYRAKLQYAETPEAQLGVLAQINRTFPFASPSYYLQQAKLAARLGRRGEAILALKAGLERFPAGFRPAGVPMGQELERMYQNWSREAPALLEQLQGKP